MWLGSRQRGLGSKERIPGGIVLLTCCFSWGCASPGPPRPPSLYIPRAVTDLAATRVGDGVALRFTVPGLSTDGQPLRAHSLVGVLCRQDAKGAPCRPVDAAETNRPLPVPGPGQAPSMLWTDPLPPPLRIGIPRPIAYRIELKATSGRSAGYSDPVYAAAGAAPPPVSEFRAEGTRSGIALRWLPVPGAGEVMLRRSEPEKAPAPEQGTAAARPTPSPAAPGEGKSRLRRTHGGNAFAEKRVSSLPGVVWLQADPGNRDAAATIDNRIEPGVAYQYTAVRREPVQVGGRTLQLESSPSAAVAMTWRDVYPPAAPTGLMALGYELPAGETRQQSGYAVDLVWEPVEDAQLAGYLVFRQAVDPAHAVAEGPAGTQLTPQPVPTPAFHDASALPAGRYRYSVVAVGTNGQRSAAVTSEILPHTTP